MRLKCIACEVLARPLYYCAARSTHMIDITLLKKGLHDHPEDLRAQLQDMIDTAARDKYDAIVLGYGLCGKSTHGLVAPRIPLVIPRAHDCITLFLGSRSRYNDEFSACPGTYWYAQDYIERSADSRSSLSMGSGTDTDLQAVYDEYVEKYGKDNADYLMEVMGAWQQHYQRAVYIDMGVADGSPVEKLALEEANRRGWAFVRLAGDLVLIRRLLEGDWESGDDFLIVPPGKQVDMTMDDAVIRWVEAQKDKTKSAFQIDQNDLIIKPGQ